MEHDAAPQQAGAAAGRVIAVATDAANQVAGAAPTGSESDLINGSIPIAAGDGVDVLIAKHLCELLHGSIAVEAQEQRLRYRVTLPTRYGEHI